ncbi:MAG TPA: ribosome-associated protein [Gammaproteobacteria bacterium]|nr:ribosome-associated protein [Gammaproteobacteria bacterium]|tara:strand:+ start:1184 stop:1660 length:477 start_codon:yes stop_codon:yes gene_type:complete
MNSGDEKSKSQMKRELLALQEFGRELTKLPDKYLAGLPLGEAIRQEIRDARRMNRRALQRQLRYIGRLLPNEDIPSVRQALQRLLHPVRQGVAENHKLESWRDKLLSGGETELNAALACFPNADRQRLRQLVRDSKKEKTANAPPKSARLLYKYLGSL